MTTCIETDGKHDFHTVMQREGRMISDTFVKVVCAHCGEVRNLYATGMIVVEKHG